MDLIDAVTAGALLAAGRPVLVMLSGGRDSVCLLDLAVRIAGAEVVDALHVNYGLRAEALADQRHCEALCEQLGVTLEVRVPQAPRAGNLHAWARSERYGAAAQLETILYRLASSPSRRALLGMRPRDGILVRPLLPFTREQTAAHCRERGLEWREDASNDDQGYARARVRARLVPALEGVHPAAAQNVLTLAELLRDEAEVLDAAVAAELSGAHEIALARLRELPDALARLVVQTLADAAAGEPAPGAARRLSEIRTLRDGALDLPHGVRATARAGVLRFGRTPPLR